MFLASGTGIRRVLIASFTFTVLLTGVPAALAQFDPGQQASQASQTLIAVQAAQQATDQATQAAQLASQQAMQAAQQAALNARRAGPQHPGYGRADRPTFGPRPGTFSGPLHVTISDPTTPKAEIFFTLDGTEPTTASTRYSGPVLVTSTAKLRAIARSPIYSESRVASAKYVIR